MKIYVFGNPLIAKDSSVYPLVVELKRFSPDIEFVFADPHENFPPERERNLIILDTVKGIKKPRLFDLSDFEDKGKTPVSLHDYDLLIHLLLLKKLKRIESVKIIGIPACAGKPQPLLPSDLQKVSRAAHTGIKCSN